MKAYAVLNNKNNITWTEENYDGELLRVLCIYKTEKEAAKARESLLPTKGSNPGPVVKVEITIKKE